MQLSHTNNQLIFGTGQRIDVTNNAWEAIGLPTRDIFHGLWLGKTGMGKSRSLCAFAVMLLNRGIPFILIDPAGDLARLTIKQLVALGYFEAEPDAFSQLLYLDLPTAQKQQLYLPFNVLDSGYDPYTTADVVLEAFKRAFPALRGGTATNIETLVKLCAFVLASHSLPLFPYMYYLLTDASYREGLLSDITDDLVLQFFRSQTNHRTGELDIATDSTVKRLFLLLFAPMLRFSLGQQQNTLNFRDILREGRSVIINLNTADLDAMRFIGSLVTVAVEVAAKARGETPAAQRHGRCVLIIDEFQNFCAQSGEALAHILDECRKMGLFLCLASQRCPKQESVKDALTNCEIRTVFRLEQPDAEEATQFFNFPIDPYLAKPSPGSTPRFYSTAEQKEMHIQAITRLEKREAFLKLPGDRLYKMQALTVDDPTVDAKVLAVVEQEYLRRYFCAQADIEAEIADQLPHIRSNGPQIHKNEGSSKVQSVNATITAVAAHAKNNSVSERPGDDDEAEILRD